MTDSELNRTEGGGGRVESERPDPVMLDAVGEVIASYMERDTLDHYRRERDECVSLDDPTCTGHYAGCLAEAEGFVERLRTRGFGVVRFVSPDASAYHDDVTAEGVAAVQARVRDLRPEREWRVVDDGSAAMARGAATGLMGVIERNAHDADMAGTMVSVRLGDLRCVAPMLTALAKRPVTEGAP